MSEQLEVLGEILARLIRDREKFEKLLENPVDVQSDACVRRALAGTELLIADVNRQIEGNRQIERLAAEDRDASSANGPDNEPDSQAPDTWFRMIE